MSVRILMWTMFGLSLWKAYTWWSPKSSYFRFHVKSGRFHDIQQISCEIHLKTLKSNNSRKTLQFYGVQWEGYVSWFHMKSGRFHEIHQISCEIRNERRTIARNGKAYVLWLGIDSDDLLLYLDQLFYQIHEFVENLNLYCQTRTKCHEQKCVQCIGWCMYSMSRKNL